MEPTYPFDTVNTSKRAVRPSGSSVRLGLRTHRESAILSTRSAAFRRTRRRSIRIASVSAVAAVTLLLGACAAPSAPIVEETATPTPTATASGPLTIPSMIAMPAESPTFETIGPVEAVADETATQVAYMSGGKRVTAVLRTPQGDGPFPAVVVVHGSVDPEDYDTGTDLIPEQRALIASGYAVLAVDMRGYADSDPADAGSLEVDPGFGWMTVLDWGMALDVVNGLRALRDGAAPEVDPENVGLVGHSLGGLLVLDAAVIAPGASDIVVALAAAPSDFKEAMDAIEAENPGAMDEFLGDDTDPEALTQYWADISPRTFFDRVTEPLLMIHGTDDDSTYPEWSQETVDAWQATGNPAEIVLIDGGDHHFKPRRDEEVGITIAALDAVLRD